MQCQFQALERLITLLIARLVDRLPASSGRDKASASILGLILALITFVGQPALAGTTGSWTTGIPATSTANGITISATSNGGLTPANGTLSGTNYWTNPYGAAVNGAASFNYVVSPGGATQTVTFTFNKAVSNPVLHIQRLGGQAGTINSSSWQLTGSNLGATPTMTRLSGNFQFQVNGAGNTFFRPVGGTFVSAACTSAANSTSEDGGTACGSVRINGTGITSLTFTVSMIGGPGSGDGLDLVWSIPNQNVVVRKQSVGGTGVFNFTGINGGPTAALNTATSNPISSTASQIPNQTAAVTITEAATTGFTLTGANCVDQNAAAVTSSLSGSTVTIAGNAYGDNGTITCTFTNQAVPVLQVAKSAPSPSLAFGTNSTYTLTTTNIGAAAATTAQVKDQLPAGLTFVSATGSNWTCANASGLITCNFAGGSIAPNGGTSTVAIVVTPIATAGSTTVTNSASIDPTGGASAPTPGAGCSPASSCAQNVSPVAAYINPAADTGTAPSGTPSTAVANVAANDQINGVQATLGTSGNATVAQSGTWPSGLSLNPTTGAITTTASLGPGTYNVAYQLCDKSTPANCRTVTTTITITANIVPVTESGTGVSGTPSTVISNVAANDSVNGSAANILGAASNATVAQSGTWPTGITLDPATGAVSITAAVLPGVYNVTYRLCDKATTPNCATMVDVITVTANIAPVADTGNAVSGTPSTPIANIAANDTVNGSPANISGGAANATVAVSGTWPAGITLNPATGAVSTAAGVQPGTYNLQYQLCDRSTPVNCRTQTLTLTVAAAILPVTESGTSVSGTPSTPIANVRTNDNVNGAAATATNSTIAQSGTWPAGIALNTTTGAITTTAAVQPGTYNVTYQLCDVNTPANCATMLDTITVTANIAPASDAGVSTSGVSSTPVTNVAANDSVNGTPATLGPTGNATVATVGTWPTGIALNPTTGAVTTTAGVPPGTYALQYQVCDKSTPANCQTQTVTVTVNGNIAPLPETGTAVSGTPSTPIANVAANDNVNGSPATLGPSGNATVAQSGTWPSGIALNTTTGAITTNASVQPGTYSLTYQLCDKIGPNCAIITDTITVSANVAPVADTGSAPAGLASTPVANVAANDSVNGAPATLGPSGNATVATVGTWPAGVTLNPTTGAVATAANVPPGTYVLQYQVCDKNTPANCQTQSVTITVTASILPVTEAGNAVSGTPSTPIANVAANDTVNNAPATLGPSGNATIAQSGTWPTGITLNTTTGAISTSASVQPGTYNVTYQLCDKNTPANCQTVVDTITVAANIAPVADSGVTVAGVGSTPVANVAANDRVNGAPATLGPSGNATVATSGVWPAGIALNPTTGAVTTTAAVAPGTYNLTYQLCDKNTPANCQTQSVTITVNGAIAPNPDTGTAVSGTPSTPIGNIAANDFVNGPAATLGGSGNATVAINGSWPAGFALNTTTGAVTTTSAVQPGTYVLPYTLCDRLTTPNCANSTATVTVSANIAPTADTGNATSGTPATPVTNVRANDTVNGSLATAANSTLAQVGTWPTGIALNPTTGAITTSANVQPGVYPITYQICDLNTPANCQTTTVTITVAASILPVTETGTATSGTASTPIANVATNDTVNGFAATLGASGNATVAQSGTWAAGITLDPATGAISVASTVRPGTYNVTYQLCDKNTPANCQTIADTITVNAAILPTNDTGAAAAGSLQSPIANVAANDSVNGSPALLGGAAPNATVAQVGTWPAGVTLDATTGAISTTGTVPPGNYSVQYRLCDTNTPVNCTNATATFTLSATIVPVADTGSGVSGTASTVITNIVSNDSVNGSAATLAGASFNATVAQSGTWPAGITLNPLNGNISIAASVQPGIYPVTYQLCDRNTPVNCATTTDTITVTAAIRPIADAGNAISGTPATPVANIAVNDTVNGVAATLGASGNATVATVGTWPAGITLDPNTGAVATAANVQPGTYVLTYQLCDKNTPANCANQTVMITVAAEVLPVNDAGSAFSGTASTPIPSVVLNDNVNGFGATLGASGNATVAQVGTWPTGITLDPATGAINTTAAVQPGTYVVQYQLCDRNTPANCVNATATVTIVGAIFPTNDSGTATSGTPSTPIANIATNDVVNGNPATLGPSGNATVTPATTWPAGITLNPTTGAISTSASVQPGTYVLPYQLCDKSVPPFCALANATVTVGANIVPSTDAGNAVSGTASTPIANVAANDNVNGAPATLGAGGNATLSQVSSSNPGVTLNPATGAVSVAAGVQPGSYTVTYRLCDRNTPANCANTTATVTVTANIVPVVETGTGVSGTASTPIANVAANDNVNGVAATLGATGNATVAINGTWPTGITLNAATGAVLIATTVQPGTYPITYELCDRNTPANCALMTDTITVSANIRPSLDTGSADAGVIAVAISNIAANDNVNGTPATLGGTGNATVAVNGTWPAGITLDPNTGAITSAATVAPGTYTLPYTLCDKSIPANCANQDAIITVFAAIQPSPDQVTVSAAGGTAVPNVTANDVVNGAPATLGPTGNATVAQSGTWPTGITLDTNQGAVTVAPGTPPGVYTLTYELCDRNGPPANCATTLVTITVTPAIVPVTENGSAVSGTPTTAIANVASNDTVNGLPATLGASGNATVAQSGTWPTGITLNPTTGAISTDASVQPGVYSVTYQLCDRNTPVNCALMTETVTVTANIAPQPDSGSMVAGALTTPIANVAANDNVNGTPATLGPSGNATVAVSGTWPAGITLNPTTGGISVGPRVQPGTYNVDYELCDKNTPANCQIATAQIVVSADIQPVVDNGTAVSGTASTPIANIAANDTVNGTPAVVEGSSGTASVSVVGTWPTGFSLTPTTGAVAMTNAVVPGTYVLPYELCDKNSPPNCANSTATVVVSPAILPTPKAGSTVSGTPATPIANIALNATVNGSVAEITGASPNATVAIVGTWPAGITLDPTTGAVSTDANVQPGVYALQFELCDTNTPVNCQTQTATITVTANIAPIADSGSAVSGSPSTPIANVAANDMVNGFPATLGTGGNATVAQSGTWPNGITLDPSTGAISTSGAVQPGTYVVTYQLCDRNTPANCQTQTATITVAGDIAPVADTGNAVSGTPSTPVTNVTANDMVNGQPATLGAGGNATISPVGTWPAGITLDPATGAVATTAAVQPGTYTMSYELCDRSTPANCQTQSVTVTVAGNIQPTADTGNAVSGTPSTPVANVAANDRVNGQPAALGTGGNATVATVGTWPAGITLDPATGAVSTTAAVQPGVYAVQYQLCDRSTPANCQTQTVTVTVAGNIQPTADTGNAVSGTPSTSVANVAANDVVNGQPATLGPSGNATVAPSGTWPAGITLDPATGAVSTSAAVQPGTYVVQYQLCDRSTPANCQVQTVTIVVASNIAPVADTGVAVSGTPSTPVANVVANDVVNGQPARLGTGGNATVTPSGTWPAGISLDPATGAVSTTAALQPGTYVVQYQLCDRNTPANCQTQSVTIVVAGSILPVADTGAGLSGTASTPVANVAANDRVNGQAATLGPNGNATVATVGTWPNGITLDPATGAVSIAASVPAGTYVMQYQLCDRNTPANCQTQSVTINVAESRGSITGTVYTDANADGQRQANEQTRANWIVELISNGVVVGTVRTDSNGNYRFDNIPQGPGYEVRFTNPENNVVYGRISNVTVTAMQTVIEQNLPIDPAGVIFNSVTRAPVAGAIVTFTDASGTSLPANCFIDPSQRSQRTGPSGEYRFDIIPGAAPQCPRGETVYRIVVTPPAGFSANSTVLLPLTGPFDPTGLSSPVRVSPLPTPATTGDVPYYMSFRLAAGDPDIVFNHIPLDPFLTRTPLVVIKTTPIRTASAGDLVPYEITVRNTEAVRRAGVTVVDVLPPGLKFVPGSATVDGAPSVPVVTDRELSWSNQTIAANGSITYRLVLVVGSGVTGGEKVNTGLARNGFDGSTVSNRGTAVITIAPSAVFDCSELIGKVFEDRNRNGYQDEGEPGVPGVRLVTVNGQLITTDEYGRYHITCAAVPDARIGSNFVLKVDTRTLPLNWGVTTDNPRSIRLTRGKFGELNFGVAPIEEVAPSATPNSPSVPKAGGE